MENFHLMQLHQSFADLDKYVPYVLLIELATLFFMLEYFLQQITSISVLHDNTEISYKIP